MNPWFLLLTIILLINARLSWADDPMAELMSCYRHDPSTPQFEIALVESLEKNRGTQIEDDLKLELARTYGRTGRTDKAFVILKELAEDTRATMVDIKRPWRGISLDALIPMNQVLKEHYGASPDLASDHALLAMGDVHWKAADEEERWNALQRLRAKYPEGDRVKEDSQAFATARETLDRRNDPFIIHDKDERPSAPVFLIVETFGKFRRPHFNCLRTMIELASRQKEKTIEHVRLYREFIEIYQPLMTVEEVTRYSGEGIKLIDDLLPVLAGENKQEAEEARKILQTAIDELKNRKPAS